jgi:hypothetical protein
MPPRFFYALFFCLERAQGHKKAHCRASVTTRLHGNSQSSCLHVKKNEGAGGREKTEKNYSGWLLILIPFQWQPSDSRFCSSPGSLNRSPSGHPDLESRHEVKKLPVQKTGGHAVVPGYLFDKRFRKPFPLFRLRGGNKPDPPHPGNVIADLFAVLFQRGSRRRLLLFGPTTWGPDRTKKHWDSGLAP